MSLTKVNLKPEDDGKGFRIPVAKDCPHTRKSSGIVLMQPDMIAALAGAVLDKDEWAVVLKGIRSEDGYEVTVTGWRMPPQERTAGHVDLADDVLEADDVCVVHSHAGGWTATFSPTDEAKLNTRYPASIVLAQGKDEFLGFAYSGVGTVILPCGSKGQIAMFIQPTVGPELATVQRVIEAPERLGGCTRYTDASPDPYQTLWTASCGLQEPLQTKVAAYGVTKDILELVDKLPRERKYVRQDTVQQGTVGAYQEHGAVGFGNYKTPEPVKVEGYMCPICMGDLVWSIAQKGGGWCSKCSKYFTIPKAETETKSEEETVWCDECLEDVEANGTGKCVKCKTPYCMDCDYCHKYGCYTSYTGAPIFGM